MSANFLFLQVDHDLAKEEGQMAEYNTRPGKRPTEHEALWYSMSSNRDHEQARSPMQSAYQATSHRHNVHRPLPSSRYPPVSSICTTTALNKPLTPSPLSEKRSRGPACIRSLIRRRPSDQLSPSHLQPEPYLDHQRSSSANGNLAPNPLPHYYPQQSSRSMPSSPAAYAQTIPPPVAPARAPAATHYKSEDPQRHQQQRAVSMNTYFEPGPPRARVRTFPESGTSSNTMTCDSLPNRPRPYTWLSPTEPFEDASDFYLFVEATSGLPHGALETDTMSPNGHPRLQGSLFARGRQNDVIPIPLQYAVTSQTSQSRRPSGGQAMNHDYVSLHPAQLPYSQLVSSSALPRSDSSMQSQLPLHMNEINLELERLGFDNLEGSPDDELPDYAQSQAEMSAKRRADATNRARELESRWNNSRRSWRD